MIFAHSGLAVTGLLAWIACLVTGLTGVAWIACVLLLPVTGLGMALVILSPPRALPRGRGNLSRSSRSRRRGTCSAQG